MSESSSRSRADVPLDDEEDAALIALMLEILVDVIALAAESERPRTR